VARKSAISPVRASDRAAGPSAGCDSGTAVTMGLPWWVPVVTRYWPIATKAR
jgi:hypothetical protein